MSTAASIIVKLLREQPADAEAAASSLLPLPPPSPPPTLPAISAAFLSSLEQLSFYERADLPPLIRALPASFLCSLCLLLHSAADTRHGRGLFTVRSLAAFALSRLSTLQPAFRASALRGPHRRLLLTGLLRPLQEFSPFSHATALQLLVDWTDGEEGDTGTAADAADAVALEAELVEAGAVEAAVQCFHHHSRVALAAQDEEQRAAQLSVESLACCLLRNIAAALQPDSGSASAALGLASHVIHTAYHAQLLLPALQLLFRLLLPLPTSSSPPAAVHAGDLEALLTHNDADVVSAAGALLRMPQTGVGRTGEEERARCSARTEQLKRQLRGEAGQETEREPEEQQSKRRAACDGCQLLESRAGQHGLCARCQSARYCSRPCQMQHWPQHKTRCRR